MNKEQSFEAAMKRLQEIVAKLEGGEETLENSMNLFEEGAKLTAFCYEKLNGAEQRVTELAKLMAAPEAGND